MHACFNAITEGAKMNRFVYSLCNHQRIYTLRKNLIKKYEIVLYQFNLFHQIEMAISHRNQFVIDIGHTRYHSFQMLSTFHFVLSCKNSMNICIPILYNMKQKAKTNSSR